jgi:hypothetical protein
LLKRKAPEDWGKKDRLREEVNKPRRGVVVDAEPNPIHVLLDEARRQGPDWLLLAPEKLSEILVGASRKASGVSGNDRATLRLLGDIISRLISASEKLGKMPQPDAGGVHCEQGPRDGQPASPAARSRPDPT